MANDIALIELDDFADINQFVDVVEMAEPSDGDFAFVDCFIIGWAEMNVRRYSNFFLSVSVNLLKQQTGELMPFSSDVSQTG